MLTIVVMCVYTRNMTNAEITKDITRERAAQDRIAMILNSKRYRSEASPKVAKHV